MFTPTDLLKQYVKEAFAKASIPAPEQRIRTWTDHARDLARENFPVLRTNAGSGIFILRESIENLDAKTHENLVAWFEDFDDWQRAQFVAQVRQAAEELSAQADARTSTIGAKALDSIKQYQVGRVEDLLVRRLGTPSRSRTW